MARRRRRKNGAALPASLASLAWSSWETIARRMVLMAGNACSPAEYRRMVREKQAAAMASTRLLLGGRASPAAVLEPWRRRAAANAKRLRRK